MQGGRFEGAANTAIFVRINSLDDYQEAIEDIRDLTIPQVSGFLLPKVKDGWSVREYDQLVSAAERRGNMMEGFLKFVPVLETVEGVFSAREIAQASPRNRGLIAGSADFMAVSLCEENSPTYFAHCGQVVLAARAANLCPIAGVCDKIDDHVQIEKFYRKMKACGFTGAVTVTPTQIDQANFEFSPSLKEMKWSRSVLAQDGLFTIQPSVQESRQMIGPPHREIAMAISRQHECIQNISVPSSHKPAFLTAQTRSHGVIFASGNHCHGAVESHVGELIFDDQSPGHER